MKSILRVILSFAGKFIDSDGDGKIEIADLPGAMARAAALQSQGLAMVHAAADVVDAIRDAAGAGQVTSGGALLTDADVQAAWDLAKVPYVTAAAEARAEMARG